MANIERKKFIFAEVSNNHNKFYDLTLSDNDDVIAVYGRVGKGEQTKVYSAEGRRTFDKLVREKLKKGYKEVNLIDSGGITISPNADLKDIAKTQIKYSSSEVAKLIEYLAEQNRHNILSNTTLSYNNITGLFSTPLGIVQPSDIGKARNLLINLSNYVEKKSYKNKTFISNLEEYLTLIPQDIGMKFIPENILPDQKTIQKQNDILDSLEVSYQTATTNPTTQVATVNNIFDVKLELLSDKKEYSRIEKLYNSTKQSMHACYGLEIKDVYCMQIGSVKRRYDSDQTGNVLELWHGLRVCNLLSVMKSGLKINPPTTAYISGKLFGDNSIYFSDQSTKSLNYAYGYWNNSIDSKDCFMLLNDVKMGKYYVPRYGETGLPKGYDSLWAKPNVSGILNNEMIIFKESQHNIKYLVKFGKINKG